ncbi:MAG: DUF721 domain-containing protein [Spirochaetales bacterium]|nr:DUF721 domain-containing protein [Spirochaetales bacterium]
MKKADDILKGLLSNYNIELGNTYSSFFKSWPTIAGQDLAAHSKVKDIEGTTLIIEVDHSGWIQILQMKKKYILGAVKKQYPELSITDIRIYLG